MSERVCGNCIHWARTVCQARWGNTCGVCTWLMQRTGRNDKCPNKYGGPEFVAIRAYAEGVSQPIGGRKEREE